MATLDLRAVMTALANQIDNNTSRAIACYDLVPPTTPQFPCVIVRTGDPFVGYHRTFGTDILCDVQIELLVMHQGTSDLDSQIGVLDMLSAGTGKTNSIIDAVSADRTLGGVVANTIVTEASGLSKVVAQDGSEAVQATVQVLVRLRR